MQNTSSPTKGELECSTIFGFPNENTSMYKNSFFEGYWFRISNTIFNSASMFWPKIQIYLMKWAKLALFWNVEQVIEIRIFWVIDFKNCIRFLTWLQFGFQSSNFSVEGDSITHFVSELRMLGPFDTLPQLSPPLFLTAKLNLHRTQMDSRFSNKKI